MFLTQCSDNKSSFEYVEEGIQFTDFQQYDQAIGSFLKAIEKDPKNPRAYYGLGGIYNYKKRFPEAAEQFKKALLLDPTYFNAHYSLGFTYENMGKKEEAEKEYEIYKDLKMKMDKLLNE